METNKVCNKCNMKKSLTEFHKAKNNKSGYQYSCKTCANIKAKEFRLKYSRQDVRDEKDKKVCCRCKIEKNVLDYSKNRSQKDGLAGECKDCKNKYNNAYINARRRYDPEFKLLGNLRTRLGDVLKSKSKSRATRQLIGVNFEIFTKWIEFQFEEGMSKENYGSVWQYDHVLPISSFNLLDEEELKKQ